MYTPKHFEVTDQAALFDLMRRFSFATLVTVEDGRPFATPLPLVVHPERGEHGTIAGHMARANPQWRHLAPNREALVLFQGDHAYISPSWYEVHPCVPTWNYMTVQAHVTGQLLEDEAAVRASLLELTREHEEGRERPWDMEALPEDYLRGMMRGIVAFELTITGLEGKFKLNQNRSRQDREGVVRALEASPSETERATAEAMRERLA